MRKLVHRIQWGFILLASVFSIFSSVAYAASADVGIEPAYPKEDNYRTESIFIMSLKPGETGKEGIRLINSGKESHTVNIYPVDSSVSVDGSFSCKQKAEAITDVGGWVKLDKSDVTIAPGEQVVVDFSVTVPKNADPGEHDGCVAVQDHANLPAKNGEGILLGFRSAIRLAITTPGKIVKKLSIQRVDITHTKDGNYEVAPVAKNEGNVSLDVKSYVQLHSIFGQKSELKSDASCPIMRGATMACPYTFERPYWGGIYKAKTSLGYSANPNSVIGKDGNQQQRVSKDSRWFFAIPDPLAAAAEIGALLALLWVIVTPIRRRLRRNRMIKRWEKHTVQDGETLMSIAAARSAKWRQIAKVNRLKAPYLIEAGKAIIVPKIGATKPKRQRKQKKSELEWFDTEIMPEQPLAETQKTTEPAAVTPQRIPHPPQSTAQEAEPRPPVASEPYYGGWVSPRSSSYEESDIYDEDFVDWREGAENKEISRIEKRIESYEVTPKIRSQLPKKPVSRKAATAKRTSSAKKQKGKKKG